MIKLWDAEPIDFLPPEYKNDPDMAAISYAIKMGMAKLIEFSKRTMLYSRIDEMPEYILDYMAVESKAMYYEEGMDIKLKRTLIKNALAWHMNAGTYGCVEDVIKTIFGEGSVTPWYEDESGELEAGYFDVDINSRIDDKTYEKFMSIIQSAKNESSHLKQITSIGSMENSLIAKMGKVQQAEMLLTNDVEIDNEERQAYIIGYMAMFDTAELLDTAYCRDDDKKVTTEEMLRVAEGITQATEMILMEIRNMDTDLSTHPEVNSGFTQSISSILT